jgi:hypothetical protein
MIVRMMPLTKPRLRSSEDGAVQATSQRRTRRGRAISRSVKGLWTFVLDRRRRDGADARHAVRSRTACAIDARRSVILWRSVPMR